MYKLQIHQSTPAIHSLGKNKLLPACFPSQFIFFSCVSPAADGIKLPACWRRLMLVLELHLPSRKDNQLSGVFNLKYSHWTMEHSAQPLHSAHIQGLDIITVLDRWAHLLCCTDVLSLQMKRLLLIQFTKVGPYRATMRLCFRTTTTTPHEMKKSLQLAVLFGFWIAPGGLFSQVPQLEFELQLSASVCRPDSGGRDGRNVFHARARREA